MRRRAPERRLPEEDELAERAEDQLDARRQRELGDADTNAKTAITHARVLPISSTAMSSTWFVVRDASAPTRLTSSPRSAIPTTNTTTATMAAVIHSRSVL